MRRHAVEEERYASEDLRRRHMLGGGPSFSFIDVVVDTARSFNAGTSWARQERSTANTTGTLECWAREALGRGRRWCWPAMGPGVQGEDSGDRAGCRFRVGRSTIERAE